MSETTMKVKLAIMAAAAFALLAYGYYQAIYAAPTEATMGEVQRIFYYHVPSAWTAFLCFLANFVASIVYLVKRGQRADAFAVTSAEVGVVFCTVVLVTGPLWARPVWGIWWTWDARLTSTADPVADLRQLSYAAQVLQRAVRPRC